jgi:hypothetical protein
MKAITITETNKQTIATKFSIMNTDIEAVLPTGYILITDFGVDEHFEVLTPERFAIYFRKTGLKLKNDFYEIMPKV